MCSTLSHACYFKQAKNVLAAMIHFQMNIRHTHLVPIQALANRLETTVLFQRYHLSSVDATIQPNADFISRLSLPPTVEDVLSSSVLTDPDDLGVYLIGASGYIMLFFPIPGVGLGGLVPSPNPITVTGSNRFFPYRFWSWLGYPWRMTTFGHAVFRCQNYI